MPGQSTHARYHTGKQKGRVREKLTLRQMPPRPEWESTEWWQQQLAHMPATECARNIMHGFARIFTTATYLGRTITHHCPVCGWEKAALVQEGGLEPCVPSPPLPVKSKTLRHGAQLTRPKRHREDED